MKVAIARISRGAMERCEIGTWLVACYADPVVDPGTVLHALDVIDCEPTSVARNKAVMRCRGMGLGPSDVLIMIDNDMAPHDDFYNRAVRFLADHKGPVAFGSPYRGAAPARAVQVVSHAGVRITQAEAAVFRNIDQVASMGTGLFACNMAAFDLVEKVGLLPWFEYQYKDPPVCSEVAATEDIVFCFPGETMVLTGNAGVRPIRDVTVGDLVLTHRGRWRNVTETKCRPYHGPLTVLRIWGHSAPVLSTPAHRYFVRDGCGGEGWKEAGSIKVGDSVGVPRHDEEGGTAVIHTAEWLDTVPCRQRDGRYKDAAWLRVAYQTYSTRQIARMCGVDQQIIVRRLRAFGIEARGNSDGKRLASSAPAVATAPPCGVRLNRRGVRSPLPATVAVTPELARVLGLYLAEGHVSGAAVCWSVNGRTERGLQAVLDAGLEPLAGKKVKPSETGDGSLQLLQTNATLATLLTALFGTGAAAKKVPACVFAWPAGLVRQFLRGYLEGDGCTSGGKVTFGSVSAGIAYGVRALFARLGIPCLVARHRPRADQIQGRKVNRQPWYYTGGISADRNEEVAGWLEKPGHKLGRAGSVRSTVTEGFVWFRVREVGSQAFDGLVYNLSVHEDESYTVSGGAVHNCNKLNKAGGKIYADWESWSGHCKVEIVQKPEVGEVTDGRKAEAEASEAEEGGWESKEVRRG